MFSINKLSNGYYVKYINKDNANEIPSDLINIKNINFKKVFKAPKNSLYIDFQEIRKSEYKKILKKLLRIKNIASRFKIEFGKKEGDKKIIAYIVNYNKENNDFILAIDAIFQKTKYDRYNYIYDTVCDYLDNCFSEKKLCDFQNNKCIAKKNTESVTGCCNRFKYYIFPFQKLTVCKYLDQKKHTCTAKCIACKLFTCYCLEKREIKFKIKDILLLDTFFNPIQKLIIKYMVFTPKEKVMKRLLKVL